ncbi:hypothetical protein B0T14DRAFT_570661 [Immersiella caudata]|uniref:Uncharacterized protein n=1 Tax=Immersiella caudata TaxID=314043 RepID=A0AA39WG40_9PEZI|nr:hypothetical protein B0T14DRAFT_570661 [Immersiella caudata]
MTDAQRAALSSLDPVYDMRVVGSKLAVLFFYLRLVSGLDRPNRSRVHDDLGILLAGWLASVGAVFRSFIPFYRCWQINLDPGNLCLPAVSRSIVWSSFAANVTSDIYLINPLPLLWGSRLRVIEKLGLDSDSQRRHPCSRVRHPPDRLRRHGRGQQHRAAGAWGTREAFVAVIMTNLPMVFPLFKEWLRPILGSSQRTTCKQYKTPDGGFRTTGGGGGELDSPRTRGTMGANP